MAITVKYNEQGSNQIVNNNIPEKRVIKSYDDEPRQSRPKAISFDKEQAELPFKEEDIDNAPLTRTERATQFRAARDAEKRAMQLKKQAEEQFNEAKGFQELLKEAKNDPTILAKALGMDPSELLRKYQNQMFNIKDEPEAPVLKPEEELKQRMDRYDAERYEERQRNEAISIQTVRQTYIQTKIIPVLSEEGGRFELLNMNGKEECAAYIYDMMNDHYTKTGEEWNVADVAEEMEAILTKDIEDKMKEVRKVSKFSKHFQPEEEINESSKSQLGSSGLSRNEVRTKPASLGSKTLSSSMENPNLTTSGERQRNSTLSREARLKRIMSSY